MASARKRVGKILSTKFLKVIHYNMQNTLERIYRDNLKINIKMKV